MFTLLKFRSMYVNNQKRLNDYLKSNPKAKDEWIKYKKLKTYDPRVTKVGRIIRSFSLDELPQLFHILQGKMSLVGPRPYLLKELEKQHSRKNTLSKVKPGLTGLWQISGRNKLAFAERLVLDEYYIRNWSLWFDIIILIKTVGVLISRKGAY